MQFLISSNHQNQAQSSIMSIMKENKAYLRLIGLIVTNNNQYSHNTLQRQYLGNHRNIPHKKKKHRRKNEKEKKRNLSKIANKTNEIMMENSTNTIII